MLSCWGCLLPKPAKLLFIYLFYKINTSFDGSTLGSSHKNGKKMESHGAPLLGHFTLKK